MLATDEDREIARKAVLDEARARGWRGSVETVVNLARIDKTMVVIGNSKREAVGHREAIDRIEQEHPDLFNAAPQGGTPPQHVPGHSPAARTPATPAPRPAPAAGARPSPPTAEEVRRRDREIQDLMDRHRRPMAEISRQAAYGARRPSTDANGRM